MKCSPLPAAENGDKIFQFSLIIPWQQTFKMLWNCYCIYVLPYPEATPVLSDEFRMEGNRNEPSGGATFTQISTIEGEKGDQHMFFQLFKEELQKKKSKQIKHIWTVEEDHLLNAMVQQRLSWLEISNKIPGTNAKICKRRFLRLNRCQERWPKQIDLKIKYLKEQEKLTWNQIETKLDEYNVKQLRDRYKNYLRPGIKAEQWTIEEDINLWSLASKYGRKWKTILQNSKVLHGRTELQIKNRFCGTLMVIARKVNRKIQNRKRKNIQPPLN